MAKDANDKTSGAPTAPLTQPEAGGGAGGAVGAPPAVPAVQGANAAPVAPVVQTVKMWRVQPPDGGPTSADVHPDEVLNYSRAGWQKGEAPQEAKGE